MLHEVVVDEFLPPTTTGPSALTCIHNEILKIEDNHLKSLELGRSHHLRGLSASDSRADRDKVNYDLERHS